MMKRFFLTVILAGIIIPVGAKSKLTITVSNPTNIARYNETVEIAWRKVAAIDGIVEENLVVLNDKNKQIASQVVYDTDHNPVSLLFQASVEPLGKTKFVIIRGMHLNFEPHVFGRQVPERFDDYAWENDLVVHRIYGSALDDPKTAGIDIWVKNTPRLIIDEWYASEHYHDNRGEGMDNYKVGNTLGGGAAAILTDGALWMTGNYVRYETLANGPIRTSVRLYYHFAVDGKKVELVKTISLDAGSRFNHITEFYSGELKSFELVVAMSKHYLDMETASTPTTAALGEWTSDHNKNIAHETLGRIYTAIVWLGAQKTYDTDHLGFTATVKRNTAVDYWCGSGWSLGGISNFNHWKAIVANQQFNVENPLKIKVQ